MSEAATHNPDQQVIHNSLYTFIPDEQAQALVKQGSMDLYHADLVGAKHVLWFWDDSRDWVEPHNESQEVATEGMNEFFYVVLDDYALKTGNNKPERNANLGKIANARKMVFKLLENEVRNNIIFTGDTAGEILRMPWLAYQSTDNFGKDELAEPKLAVHGTFLHFGSSRPEHLPEDSFNSTIRFYLSPKVDKTPHAAAVICQEFLEEMGHLPTGKFMDDATAKQIEDRNDRLVFWASTPKELGVLVSAAAKLAKEEPEIFANRKGIQLGSKIATGYGEVPTARFAQNPSPALIERLGGQNESFTSSRVWVIKQVFDEVFPGQHRGVEPGEENILRFVSGLKAASAHFDINPDNFAFNADQDLSVIEATIANAA